MNTSIECRKVTAQYPVGMRQRICNLKKHLKQSSGSDQSPYPISDFSHIFKPGLTVIFGPNGSGKSTLLRLLAGLLSPLAGIICFNGRKIDMTERRRLISYLPQIFDFYPDFTAYEMLEYIAVLKGGSNASLSEARMKEILSDMNLSAVAGQKVKTYSRGMKQRLGIAQALLNSTQILLLDEPTAGLDPEERNRFRHLIAQLGEQRLILFSSSALADIVCADEMVILRSGKCCFEGTPSELIALGDYPEAVGANRQEALMLNLQKGYQKVLNTVNQS